MFMKRIMALATAALIALAITPCAWAEGEAAAVIVTELSSGAVATERAADEKLPAAGLLRLPGLVYVCTRFDEGALLDLDEISVSRDAAATGGPTAFIAPGERIKAGVLVRAAVMITAGDAIFALAERAAGSASAAEDKIKALMWELGVDAEGYTLSGGLPSTTARELALMMAALAKSPTYCALSSLTYEHMEHENGSKTELANPNGLLKTLEGCFGGSTGSEGSSNYCGVFAATRGSTTYVCAVIGAKSASARADEAKAALESAFSEYEPVTLAKKGEVMARGVPLYGGTVAAVDLIAAEDCSLIVKKGTGGEPALDIPESLEAPIAAGETLGRVVYVTGAGEESVALTVAEDYPVAGMLDFMLRSFVSWAHG